MDRRMRGFYFSHVSPSCNVYMEMGAEEQMRFLLCFPAPIGKRRAIVTNLLQRILRRFDEASIRLATA